MLAIVKNPGAGGVEEESERDLITALEGANVEFALFEDDNPATAADHAIAKQHVHMCACGGDGTVAGVANSMLRSDRQGLRLSIVPMGTGNIIATALGIPTDIEDALKLCIGNNTKKIDAGKVGGAFFLLGLGIGATERFVTEASSEAKRKIGRLAYVYELVKSTRDPLFKVDIRTQGGRFAGEAKAITLASLWGTERLELLEGTASDDGVMECVINRRLTLGTMARLAIQGIFGGLRDDRDVETIDGEEFSIATTPNMPVQLDGNETDVVTPIEVRVIPRAIEISVPGE